jgi:hypothetical protein
MGMQRSTRFVSLSGAAVGTIVAVAIAVPAPAMAARGDGGPDVAVSVNGDVKVQKGPVKSSV